MDVNSNTAAVPIGDGIHDDTAAIQALLDTGASLVELPAPKVSYIISRTLLIGDGQELRLGRFTPIRLADGSNCPMLANRDPGGGNRHVAVSGGVWDMNNLGQRHNLHALFAMDKARRRSWLDERQEETQEAVVRWPEGRYSPDYFLGVCFRFHNVEDFVLRGATISRLVLRDCEQINRTGRPMRFLHNRGEIGELIHENTRLVSAPGENILVDTETPIPPYARDWATMDDIAAHGMAHPARGAKRPDSEVAAGFGEGMIRVFPFVGEDANAFAGKIDEYGFTVQPGVCWCRYKNFPIRIEATASKAAAWFRIRFPETGARNILADSALSVAFSEPVAAKETVGGNTIYRFAPGGRPIVVQASRGPLAESEADFDRVANLARRAWNDVCR